MNNDSITQNTNSYKKTIINLLDDLEEIFLAFASRLGPYLAPVGPAYFVGRAVFNHLQANLLVAVIMAIALEFLGVTTTKTTLRCWLWNNQTKRKTDPTAPFNPMLILTIISYLIGIGLAVGLEVAPTLAIYAPGLFFILAGIGYFTLATTINLTTWEREGLAETAAKKAINTLNDRIKTLTNQLKKLTTQLTARQQQLNDVTTQITEYQTKLTTLKTEIEHAQTKQTSLTNQKTIPKKPTTTTTKPPTPKAEKINRRRQKVLALLEKGMTNAQIATELEVGLSTVKSDKKALNGQLNPLKNNPQGGQQ